MKAITLSLLLIFSLSVKSQVKQKSKEVGVNMYGKGGVIAKIYKDSLAVYDTMQVIKRLWKGLEWKTRYADSLQKELSKLNGNK